MSYIRSTSNPEGLYIFGSHSGQIELVVGENLMPSMPRHVFEGVLRRWFINEDDAAYRGAMMRWRLDPNIGEQVALSYNRWENHQVVEAYPVTWMYICTQFKWAKHRGVR